MKNIVAIAATIFLFAACTKKEITTPATTIFYQDNNIEISNFGVQNDDDNGLKICFEINYANNIKAIEVLSGSTENALCAFDEKTIDASFAVPENFSCNSSIDASAHKYFMIKFITNDGNWGYTPVYDYK